MTNDFYVKRSRTVLNHNAPHQKPKRIRNNKNYELDINFNENPRSKVVLSKGHTVPAQYAVLNSKGIINDL